MQDLNMLQFQKKLYILYEKSFKFCMKKALNFTLQFKKKLKVQYEKSFKLVTLTA